MMHIETFKEGKTSFVKLPAVEFNNLLSELEDLRDIHAVRSIKYRVKNKLAETFPSELAYELAEAKNSGQRIAIWREFRGLKRDELAKTVGVTGSYISMIENGKRKGNIELFSNISKTLGCDIDDLC